jgi:PST family polysaccharide transporter
MNKLRQTVLSLGAIQMANYILPLISVPIIARILGPEKIGVINFIQAFITYFTLLINYGFNITAVRRMTAVSDDNEKRSMVFSEVFFSQLLLFLVSLAIFLLCMIIVPEFHKEWEVSVFTFALCIATLLTQEWLFQAMQELPKMAILNFFSKLASTALILLVLHKQADYILYAFLFSAVQIVVAAISFIWSMKRYCLRLYRIPVSACISLILGEKTFFLSVVVINLYTTTNVVLLGFMTNLQNVGYFTAAQKISSIIVMVFIIPFRQAFFPHVSKALKQNRDEGISIAKKLLPVIVWPAFLIGLITTIFSKQIILLIYGYKFEPAISVLQILAFLPLIKGLSNIWGLIVMMNLKLDRLYFKVTIASAITGILLNILLTPTYAYMGSAVALLLSEAIGALLIFFYLQKQEVQLVDATYFNPVKLNSLLFQQLKH